MNERSLGQLFFAVAVGDMDRYTELQAARTPTPSCPALPRFRRALLREDWTAAETAHKHSCAYCQRTEPRVLAKLTHPTPVQLFWHAQRLPDADEEQAVGYHCRQDKCRRCLQLRDLLAADGLLVRLAARVTQRLAGAAEGLRRLLETCAVAADSLLPPTQAEQRFAFEDGRTVGILYRAADPTDPRTPYRLCLEQHASTGPALLQVALGSGKRRWERLVILRPWVQKGSGGGAPCPAREERPATTSLTGSEAGRHGIWGTEIHLDGGALEKARIYLYPLDPVRHLQAEDAERLWESFNAAQREDLQSEESWRTWAGQTLQRSSLDAEIHAVIERIAME